MNHKQIDEREHKTVGKELLWFNGRKWLVRETFSTNKKADDFLKEVKDKQHDKG